MYHYETFMNINEKTINDNIKNNYTNLANYILEQRGLTKCKSNQYRYRNIIKRCKDLYDKYQEKINLYDFSIDEMARLNKTDWEEFLIYLDNIINKNDNYNCNKFYKKSKENDGYFVNVVVI
jgi:hypothetical protein